MGIQRRNLDQSAGSCGGGVQRGELGGIEQTPLTGLHGSILDRPDGCAHQAANIVVEHLAHATYLTIPTLHQNHLDERRVPMGVDHTG